HSRVLYGCLEPLGADPRSPLRESDPANLSNLAYFDEPWTEWSQFVAANAVLDTAFTAMIEACVGGSVEVLQHRLRKMLMEERYHFLHGRSWLRSGIDSAPLNRAWQEAIEWFGPPDGDTAALHRQGKLSMGPGELRARLEEQLETKATHADIDWKQWDGVRRRGSRSEEHTSELQSRGHLVCRLLLDTATSELSSLSLHDALPIWRGKRPSNGSGRRMVTQRLCTAKAS